MRVASLSMYDRPETAQANDALWSAIQRHLGVDAPVELTRSGNLWEIWQSPDLCLSQTCGYPYRARLHGQVQLVGTPVYDIQGCPPGHYNSIFVARKDDPRIAPKDFSDARFAFNESLSQSGWAAPQNYARAMGFEFSNTIQSGGHLFSARAVAENNADIAAIDALTWILINRHDDFAKSLKVVGETPYTPTLPFITANGNDARQIFDAVEAAIESLSQSQRDTLALTGITKIPAENYLSVPNPPPPQNAGTLA